jgi:hypothetical protein
MTLRTSALAARVIAAIGLVLGVGVSAAPAYAQSFPSQVCILSNPGLNQCINNWGGHLTSGNPIKYYQKGSGGGYKYNNWDINRIGTVVGVNCGASGQPACWPFRTGTGLNKKYDGDPVLTFDYQGQYASPTGYCLDSSAYNASTGSGQLHLISCNTDSYNQKYVYSTYSALIPVAPSNANASLHGGAYPVWLGCTALNCANGQPVIATNVQSYNRPYGFSGAA